MQLIDEKKLGLLLEEVQRQAAWLDYSERRQDPIAKSIQRALETARSDVIDYFMESQTKPSAVEFGWCAAESLAALELRVNARLKLGWALHGGITHTSTARTACIQYFVRPAQAPEAGE